MIYGLDEKSAPQHSRTRKQDYNKKEKLGKKIPFLAHEHDSLDFFFLINGELYKEINNSKDQTTNKANKQRNKALNQNPQKQIEEEN